MSSSAPTSMDVDTPVGGSNTTSPNDDEQQHPISIHPLAIVHMSDQFTRVTCGGSPLDRDAPVVGLLFGIHNGTSKTLDIRDADDIEISVLQGAQTQVALHQAVFPMHRVVGWYRVLADPHPTADDIVTTSQLKEHYGIENQDSFVFALLQVPEVIQDNDDDDKKPADVLPLMLYQVSNTSPQVLLAHSDWHLQTFESERIAVERVVREQPHHHHSRSEEDDATSNNTDDESSSQYSAYLDSLQHSLQSMQDRLAVLVDFLQQVESGSFDKEEPPLGLLRRVQTLVCQVGPLASASRRMSTDSARDGSMTQLMSHLAVVSQTVGAVRGYMDKVQNVQEQSATSSSAGAAGSTSYRRVGRMGRETLGRV